MRQSYEHRELRQDYRLNPQERLFGFNNHEIVSSADVAASLALGDNIDIFARDLVDYRKTNRTEEVDNELLEAYASWSNHDRDHRLDMGKKRIRWGGGFTWAPLDIVLPRRPIPRNFDNQPRFDEGIPMAEWTWIHGQHSLVLLAGAQTTDQPHNRFQYAAKYTFSTGTTELTLATDKPESQPWIFAAGINTLLSDSLTFRLEANATRQRELPELQQIVPAVTTPQGEPLAPRYSYQEAPKSLRARALIGVNYTTANLQSWILEYYFNAHGYGDEDWQTLQTALDGALNNDAYVRYEPSFITDGENLYQALMLDTLALTDQQDLRRHYLYGRYSSGRLWSDWRIEQSVQYSVADDSWISYSALSYLWGSHWTLQASWTHFEGESDSEYGLIPYQDMAFALVRYDF
ncbi:hypothetical protein QQM79_18645 [Marinobacteraceae bacterium S3BR75-40.1]